MGKKKKKTMIYKTLHRKLNNEQHEHHRNPGGVSCQNIPTFLHIWWTTASTDIVLFQHMYDDGLQLTPTLYFPPHMIGSGPTSRRLGPTLALSTIGCWRTHNTTAGFVENSNWTWHLLSPVLYKIHLTPTFPHIWWATSNTYISLHMMGYIYNTYMSSHMMGYI